MNRPAFPPSSPSPDQIVAIQGRARAIIAHEAEALRHLGDGLDDGFARACWLIAGARRRLVVSGMGKSGHIGRKIAASFSATGTPALFLHPAEASHGDLGMMTAGDVLLVLSNSGNTAELAPVLRHARALGVAIIGMVARPRSMVGDMADVLLLLPDRPEACEESFAPTTSTVMQLALGDALALSVMEARGVGRKQIRALHPGGAIGQRLAPVGEVMCRVGLPLVSPDAPMRDVVRVISDHRFGLAGVVDGAGRLLGVISDGDLRRHLPALGKAAAGEVMTHNPRSLCADMVAVDALQWMNEAKITAAFVVRPLADGGLMPVGLVHMHDLLPLGLVPA
ncbi:KpsF/GutQ family sugar-phosphate isomerase [Novosphingobium sp. KACC 22771]|uniref:KpsF/GutQ family sugar-phosphate isomerase n=1 Tax=Novosphingobium sp. KACC 22771 TaxID=3025670 RepID=UPI002366238A|nr:KpsF/GutQ family sugar-phosphate isomerase [Novosphingobium sp. KACC 22771]WDF71901.1 KpsF/GutQ family sugar-phosphate isomerase [Novosphingobium sp. KACC 22771]